MQTPPRLCRVHMDNRPRRPPLSEKQREREERIIFATQTLMASFPGDHFTIGKIAHALRLAPATVRRHFSDIESILSEILFRHVLEISRAIGRIPHDAPNRAALQRAAYLQATRTAWGAFTEPHRLLIQVRHTLPDDLAKPIEDMRRLIGEALAGDHADAALALLDTLHFQAHQIEALLVTYMEAAPGPAAAPGSGSAHQLHATSMPQSEPAAPAASEPATAERAPKPAPLRPNIRADYRKWELPKRYRSRYPYQPRAGPE